MVSSPSTSPTVARGPSEIRSKGRGFQLFITTEPVGIIVRVKNCVKIIYENYGVHQVGNR